VGVLRLPALRALLLLLVVTTLTASGAAAQPTASEYEVKAAFLYNFARFVEWPEGLSGSPFVIGVFGEDPFGSVLDQTVGGKRVGGSELVVRRFRSLESLEPCRILFVGAGEQGRFAQVVAALHGAPVLTIGESEGFLERGGMINLRLEGQKVRFEINAGEAERAGLKISSQLLKLAIRVVGMPAEDLRSPTPEPHPSG
jgi:hypothetical protein